MDNKSLNCQKCIFHEESEKCEHFRVGYVNLPMGQVQKCGGFVAKGKKRVKVEEKQEKQEKKEVCRYMEPQVKALYDIVMHRLEHLDTSEIEFSYVREMETNPQHCIYVTLPNREMYLVCAYDMQETAEAVARDLSIIHSKRKN